MRPNASWVDVAAAVGHADGVGDRQRRPRRHGHVVQLAARRRAHPALGRPGIEAVPLRRRVQPDRPPQLVDLLARQQRRVVQRIAGDGQAPPLDGVGEHDARAVGDLVARPVGVEQDADVVTAEVLHERGQLVVGDVGDRRRGRRRRRRPGSAGAARPRDGRTATGTPRWTWRRCARRSASPPGRVERGRQQVPVLGLDDVPAGAVEELHQLLDLLVGDDAVEALAVRVDDPHHVAEALQRRVGDRLPDVALVELGVAGEGDEPGRAPSSRPAEVGLDVPAGRGGEERGDDAEPDGPGGEVEDVGVLGPARVRLQPAELAQAGQVRAVELAGEVLDGVVHGRGVRLDGDLVPTVEVPEPQRRHDRHHRRRRRLVPADLDLADRARRPLAVGVVDHPHGQPQHPPLHRLQRVAASSGAVTPGPTRGRAARCAGRGRRRRRPPCP